MHDMRRGFLQSDGEQCVMHGLHDGIYDDRRHADGSHSSESMRYVCCGLRRHYGDWRQQRMHDMRCRVLQGDREQCGVHGLHDGVHDDRRHADGSHGVESLRYVQCRIRRVQRWWYERLYCLCSWHVQTCCSQQRMHCRRCWQARLYISYSGSSRYSRHPTSELPGQHVQECSGSGVIALVDHIWRHRSCCQLRTCRCESHNRWQRSWSRADRYYGQQWRDCRLGSQGLRKRLCRRQYVDDTRCVHWQQQRRYHSNICNWDRRFGSMRRLSRKRCVTCWRDDMLYPHRTTDRSALDTAYGTTDGSANVSALKPAHIAAIRSAFIAAIRSAFNATIGSAYDAALKTADNAAIR